MKKSDPHQQFIAYYHKYKDKIFNYLMYRLSFDTATCEELLMDVVLKAYEKFHQFDENKGSFKSWLFAIAHNHLVSHWKSKKEIQSLDLLEKAGVNVATVAIEEKSNQHFHQKNIQEVFGLMSESDKEVISLRYLNDLEYEEIAQITGRKEGAIRTNLSRALARFKKLYNKLYKA